MNTRPPDGAGPQGRPVDDLQRCTSYLDGMLDAEERAALEAELAGDAELRALLDALRQADRALATRAPTALPEGARDRLDVALTDALSAAITPLPRSREHDTPVAPTTAQASGRPVDELSARRRRSATTTTAGVAAGLVLLAGGVVGISQLAPDDIVEQATRQADQAEVLTPEDERALSDLPELAGDALPVVVDEGRTMSDAGQDADRVLGDPQLQALAQRDLSGEDGAQLAMDIQRRLLGDTATEGLSSAEDASDDHAADSDLPAEPDGDIGAAGEMPADVSPLVTADGMELGPRVSEDVRRCLTTLLAPGQQAVPVTIELVTLDGGDAAVFGLLTLDPATDTFSRIEVWTLALDACQVLRFDQS